MTSPAPRKTPKRILVIMLRRIGDVVLTTPAVRALRRLFPEAAIDFLVEPPSDRLLAGNPDLSSVLVYGGEGPRVARACLKHLYWLWRVRRGAYDWVIDYMGNPRTAMLTYASGAALRAGPGHVSHRWAYSHPLRESPEPCYSALEKIRILRGIGLEPDERDHLPRLALLPESERLARESLRLPQGKGPVIGLAPASRRATRRWPAERFSALGRLLRERAEARLVVFWGPGEKALAEEIRDGIGRSAVLAPRTPDLRDLAALLARCDLLVSNCNGPKHIAVAVGTPTVTVHGSSDPSCWTPAAPDHAAVRADGVDCSGCRKNTCSRGLECLTRVSPERVLEDAERLLGRTREGRQ